MTTIVGILTFIDRMNTTSESTMIASAIRNMRFSTMWYVRPAKAQISLRIRVV